MNLRNGVELVITALMMVGWVSEATGATLARASAPSPSSADPGLERCDDLYEHRAELARATEAFHCYLDYLSTTQAGTAVRKAVHQNVFHLVSRLHHHSETEQARLQAIELGLEHAERVKSELPGSGLGYYWEGAFRFADCERRDESRRIPSCLLQRKGDIVALLQKSLDLEPSVNGNGADRLLGVMMREIPSLLGGDAQLSFDYLKRALIAAPNFSANHLEYARTLQKLRRHAEARDVLKALVASNCFTMNPLVSLECTEDQKSAEDLLRN